MYTTKHGDATYYLTTYFTFTSEIQHGYFGLPQHIICTHLDQDMKYSAIHLHFQGFLSGILSLLTSKTHQNVQQFKILHLSWFRNSATYNAIMQCHTDYKKI